MRAVDAFRSAATLIKPQPPAAPPRPAALAEEARVKLSGLGVKARKDLEQVLAWQRREARR
ncbi:hypothetical protein [Corallococcus sp. AB038B]|uniref:hypothetical protein n=1 Tax=Corallococcus sp. AB038B TaxID=2316718 RepID=UPI000ECB116D|nr:hypothetical protein [Corallococcus sp. AB038B]RKH95684.1 hypothetical protein D7Y04_32245 [Corallococcus sp. AB038B]